MANREDIDFTISDYELDSSIAISVSKTREKAMQQLTDPFKKLALAHVEKWSAGEVKMLSMAHELSESDIVKYVPIRYAHDKAEFLKTGIWPQGQFYYNDYCWSYYYFLQLTDMSINLDKYLDFDYDVVAWPRDRLIEIFFAYGLRGLFKFCAYNDHKNNDLSFSDFMISEITSDYERLNGLEKLKMSLASRGRK